MDPPYTNIFHNRTTPFFFAGITGLQRKFLLTPSINIISVDPEHLAWYSRAINQAATLYALGACREISECCKVSRFIINNY